jgi:predicted metal-dependent HD superfamily phosphohydrolase
VIRSRWTSLWQRLGARTIPDIEPLLIRLREPQRHYHTLTHIRHCLAVYDRGPLRDDTVELALWLHDAIYDPQARDNEERSADWCTELAKSAGVSNAIITGAHACILATRHRHLPATITEQLTVSIDLVILGEDTERFRSYDRAIRKEYSWVPITTYRQERARVLRNFLSRPTIFPLPWFEQRFGRQARLNLRNVIADLERRTPIKSLT